MRDDSQKKILLNNWLDEKEAWMLYSQMAAQEKDPKRRRIYQRLSEVEKRHAELWEEELRKIGLRPEKFKPRLKVRVLSFFGRVLGHNALLEVLEKAENSAVRGYAQQEMNFGETGVKETLRSILPERRVTQNCLPSWAESPRAPWRGRGGTRVEGPSETRSSE